MPSFAKQLGALIHKNLLISVARRPIGFLLSIYVAPLAILGLLLAIPSLIPAFNTFGISDPAPIRPLADTISKKLVVVRPPELGSDVDPVIETFTRPVRKELLVFQANESELLSLCLPNTRGVSDCHAIVIFKDSPLTTRVTNSSANGHTWNYTIRADPARDNRMFDLTKHRSDQEDFYMPLQLAINNAITNSTTTPETVMFTPEPQESYEQKISVSHAAIVGRIFVFALIAAHFTIIYRLTTFITSERDAGLSQLIDSMGGGSTISTRVLSWIITFDLVALPCYIGFGILYQRLLFQASSVGTLIGWQILSGFAINSSTTFAAAFFSKSRVSAIYVMFIFLLMSIVAQMYASETKPHPQSVAVGALSFLFPSSNSVYFTQQMCLWQIDGRAADPGKLPPESAGLFSESYGVSQGAMLGFLTLNILIYTGAAIGTEKLFHGIHFRKRRFSNPSHASAGVVAQTFDIKKRFVPSFLTRIFCCGRRKPVLAVDGVSFQAHMGQIMCLVGPNGSGKTTTLHMMSGFISPTEGSIAFGAKPSQIGICPQRNTLWDELTVEEHVYLWDRMKAGNRSRAELDQLIEQCDLHPKRKFKANQLSGGQKRKLQLACMFVGDSSVCLIDECTSGLDPLSRRAIWEILLDQRSKRSIIFTTHFLDEVDVLADQIVLLAHGKIKCQGSSAQLKNMHGGGYKVIAPLSAAQVCNGYPLTIHQERLIYDVPDSQSAAQMLSTFVTLGMTDVAISGPQFEDVFLNLLRDDSIVEHVKTTSTSDPSFEMTPGRVTSFWAQFAVLYRKRWTVLKRFWGPYLFVIIVPLAVTFVLGGLLKDYKTPSCEALTDIGLPLETSMLRWNGSCPQESFCEQLSVAPQAANARLFGLVNNRYPGMAQVDPATYDGFVVVQNSRDEMLSHIGQNRTKAGHGGVFAGSSTEAPLIAYKVLTFGAQSGSLLLDVWSQMQGGIEINSSQESIPKSRKGGDMSGLVYVFFSCLLQVLYPAFFALYPAMEKARKIRALQYANGVRRAPLWVAYGTFDFLWIFVLSAAIMVITSAQLAFNGPVLLLLPILALYGLSATLMGYTVAHFTNGPLKSYLATLGIGMVSYTIIGVSLGVSEGAATNGRAEDSMAGITFGANLFMPIGNVFRTLLLGLNLMEAGCKDGRRVPVGSLHGFGGPLLYLSIQANAIPQRDEDMELNTMHSSAGGQVKDSVTGEVTRAENAGSDLLRALHVSKSFGSNKAVDDLTFGLARGEVMALIGPNGAGKSTLVNMIQGELSPDKGEILLCQEDSRSPGAKKNLGVCPQYDAPDFMNTRDHLFFYARVKGIKKPKADVEHLMDRLNLTPHARTQASKLSGGNKRKLMLAIALMGTPPVVVLDEPTSTMDAVAKRSFWKIIQEIAAERSVLLTTHSMEEADALATRTTIMARRFLAIGTTQGLRERYSNIYYVNLVLMSAPTSSVDEMSHVGGWMQSRIPGVRFEPPSSTTGSSPVANLIEILEREKDSMGVEFYSISGPTLENVFLSVVRENQVQEEDGAGTRPLWKRLLKRE
ncbi:ABC transporter [Hirsutella rhossiliensis]|uniref:ABC transporter domain-containing protein n=1 Tax=Hirsutella rhossiliensis TaxID=111463 RepID=A0A9P8N353_9HYPO|nr:ABC transporter domain-containing protein [Hirsutella rhossiliensis]KAH0966047.1 ABC transporter domain-containing protein [Hirsutella rhossiliensis]